MGAGLTIGRRVAVLVAAALMLSGCLEADVRTLAGDDHGGRANGTAGSALARTNILGYLRQWTEGPMPGAGDEAYFQHFEDGTNVIGIVPGTDLADEYVMVGAHYDGLGGTCRRVTADDGICNGATDNATGTAIVLDVLRWLHVRGGARRSVIVALWDREEDGLLGSNHYVANPVVPLADTVAYVNLDIQGANLRPTGRNVTFAVGAETGGSVLVDAVSSAAAHSTLDTRLLSLVFGLGRSDHAVFAANRVPTVFFTDSTGPCYHTVDDEVDVVDWGKLRQQANTARRTVFDLADRDDTPAFVDGLPLATFDDALAVQALVHLLLADIDTFSAGDQQTLIEKVAVVDDTVAAGPEAFADTMLPMLLAVNDVVNLVDNAPCDGYLADAG